MDSGSRQKHKNSKEDKEKKRNVPVKYKIVSSRYQKNLSTSSGTNSSSDHSSSKLIPRPLKHNIVKLTLEGKEILPNRNLKTNRCESTPFTREKEVLNPSMSSTTFFNNTICNKSQADYKDVFSSTVVSGNACFIKHINGELASLSDLPDISVISSIGVTENNNGNIQPLRNSRNISTSELTEADLYSNYLEYLTWAYLDLKSEQTFSSQVEKSIDQIRFLKKSVDDKTEELKMWKVKVALISHYENVCHWHKELKDSILTLSAESTAFIPILKLLSENFESKLNKVRFENIYNSSQPSVCSETLRNILSETLKNIEAVNKQMEEDKEEIHSLSTVSSKLKDLLKELNSDFSLGENLAESTLLSTSCLTSSKTKSDM